MRAAAGEDDDLDRVVLHRIVKGGVEVVGHLEVLRVPRLGPVLHDPRDARLRPFHDDGFVCGHGLSFPRVLAMLTISANDRQEPSAANRLAKYRHSGSGPLRPRPGISRLLAQDSGFALRAPRNDEEKITAARSF